MSCQPAEGIKDILRCEEYLSNFLVASGVQLVMVESKTKLRTYQVSLAASPSTPNPRQRGSRTELPLHNPASHLRGSPAQRRHCRSWVSVARHKSTEDCRWHSLNLTDMEWPGRHMHLSQHTRYPERRVGVTGRWVQIARH